MYTTNYTNIELFNPQQFESDLKTSTPDIKVFRDALKRGHDILKERFQAHQDATNYVLQRAWLVDQIVLQVWQQFCSVPKNNTIALIAVGGYGRGELHPHSDVDLLILLESAMDAETQDGIENFLRLLWDLRLKVGHGVRTLEECVQEAAADITVATNLIEARLLTGDEPLFQSLQAVIAPNRIWSHKNFFAAKIEEQTQRHLKYDGSTCNLEPNIKESPGGLRDIQMIAWVAKRYFGATTLHDLVQHGFLSEKEYQTLSKAQEFLWDIRCRLHLTIKRNEDRLLFEYQRILATAFGYEDDDAGLGVEKLMKRYYRTVKEISTLNDMLLQLFHEAILYADAPAKVYPLNKRFQVRNDFIEVTHDEVFVNYPFALLEIFLLMQQHPEIKGMRAATIRLIIHYNYLIDNVFINDLRARSLFFEIFRQPHGLTHALQRMNHYGILAAYIPAFGKIVGQMQYDLFHVYTVDQHTLFVVRNLRRLNMPEFFHEFPFCSKLIQSIPKPELLHLAALFHDIAKGRGGNHSKLGEIDALNFCKLHGLSDNDARFVGWLVRNHLLMSTTAQRQDIDVPDVVKTFAQAVEDTTHLDYLYLLTVADIRATSPDLWNSWKDALFTELYHKTHAILEQDKGHVLDKQLHIQNIKKKARRLLLNETDNERLSALWKELGDEYFLYSAPQNVATETQAILNQTHPDIPIVLEREDAKGGTKFIMITRDRDYLFAATTFFLEQHNLSIVDAYIVPTQGEYTISGYTILENNESERVSDILQELKQALIRDDSNLQFEIIRRRVPIHIKQFSVPTRVTFTQDHINNHTITEVNTSDRPGVLSRIAQAFVSCEVRVKKAKIGTFGTRVEDIFFITDHNNHALYSADQLDCLRDELVRLLDEDMPMEG
ncbi:MAG: [protein-PII] uridylyltransferase [Pseudomonadota bacterium]